MEIHARWQVQDEIHKAIALHANPSESIYDDLKVYKLKASTVEIYLVPFKVVQYFISFLSIPFLNISVILIAIF